MTGHKRSYRKPRQGEIGAYLAAHASQVKARGYDELRFRPSPCCKHDKPRNMSCQINTESGLWRCFACEAKGNWYQLTKYFGNPIPMSDRYDLPNFKAVAMCRDFSKVFQSQTRTPVSSGKYPKLLEYAQAMRGINPETLDAFKVSSMGEHNLRWPLYAWLDDSWQIVNMKVRKCLGDGDLKDWFGVKGGPTGLLIGNHLLDLTVDEKRAIIFEGQWDAMVAYQLGIRNVFSLPNGASSVNVTEMLQYIPEDWEIWLAMDMDEAGMRAVESFFAQLGTEKVARLIMPYKDLNDWYLAEPNLTAADVLATARGSTEILTQDMDGFEELDFDCLDGLGEPEILCPTPWLRLTNLLAGGFRASETTGVLGPSGKGKTTLVNQIAVQAAKYQTRAAIISLEGPRASFIRKVKEACIGLCDKESLQAVANKLHLSKLNGRKITDKQLTAELERLLNLGTKLIIIDNLDFLCAGDSNRKLDLYGSIIELCRDFEAHGIFVWQPGKIESGAVINSGHQKGYSQVLQDSDNYLTFNAIGGLRVLEVEKTREAGLDDTSSKVWLRYERDKNLLLETEGPETQGAKILDLSGARL